jgi:GH24 family phage-related lysozyme (muramidase)
MFSSLERALSTFFRKKQSRKPAKAKRQTSRVFEGLEGRSMLSANIVISPMSIKHSYAGVGVTNNAVAEFRSIVNGQLDKNAGSYKADIDWGDGSGFQPGKIILKGQTSSSPFQVKGSHVYDTIGTYRIAVRVSGNGDTEIEETATETVRQMPSGLQGTKPPVSESGGKQVQLIVSPMSSISTYAGVGFELNNVAAMSGLLNGQQNKSVGDYKAYINWGDSTEWVKASIAPRPDNSHPILIKGSHVYDQAGTYRVVVYAMGPDGTSVSEDTTTVVVNNMPNNYAGMKPSSSGSSQQPADVALTVYPQSSINAYAGVQIVEDVVAEFNGFVSGKKATSADISQYTAQINWGDSSTWHPATIVSNDDGSSIEFEVLGNHTYETAGTYRVTVYVNGPDGTSKSEQVTTVIVANMAKPATPLLTGSTTISVEQGQTLSGSRATFDSTGTSTPPTQLRATVTWGDGTPAQNTPIQLRGGTTYDVVPPPKTYNTPGVFEIVVTVDDQRGNESTWKSTVNVAPRTTSGQADLVASINAGRVVPDAAKDLNLNFFFGGERLSVPVVVQNIGGANATGSARVSLYLSTTPSLSGTSRLLHTRDVTLNLAAGAKQTVTMTKLIPTDLVAGQRYYLVARITSSIREITTSNNDGATSRGFQYVGNPASNPTVFSNGTFFTFVRNALKNTPALPSTIVRDSFTSFLKHFEGAKQYAYLDSKKIPTIGVGINLNTVNGTIKEHLADAVRAFYLQTYKKNLSSDDTKVIEMLKGHAYAKAERNAISQTDVNTLFQEVLPKFQKIARDTLGASVYEDLNTYQKVAVVSMVYNLGGLSKFPTMVKAFKSGNLLQAGFELVNAIRTTEAPGLTTRTGVEFANFFEGQEPLLGKTVAI